MKENKIERRMCEKKILILEREEAKRIKSKKEKSLSVSVRITNSRQSSDTCKDVHTLKV